MKQFLFAALTGLAFFMANAQATADQAFSTEQSALIQCNFLWSAKLTAQPGSPSLLARKAQKMCAGQDLAYETAMRSALPYKKISDQYMRKVHASQLRSNASMIIKTRVMMKKKKQ